MIKKWCFFGSLIGIVAYLSLGFKSEKQNFIEGVYLAEDKNKSSSLLFNKMSISDIPFTKNLFVGFKEAIALKESNGKYKKINTLGYLGKYQFGGEALKGIGVKNTNHFLNNPMMQEKAFIALLSKNKFLLQSVISKHEGSVIDGVLVTESGILAAAHLAGAGSVKKYFRLKGKGDFKDAYGTSLQSYLKKFGGYDTSVIVADNNATVYSI